MAATRQRRRKSINTSRARNAAVRGPISCNRTYVVEEFECAEGGKRQRTFFDEMNERKRNREEHEDSSTATKKHVSHSLQDPQSPVASARQPRSTQERSVKSVAGMSSIGCEDPTALELFSPFLQPSDPIEEVPAKDSQDSVVSPDLAAPDTPDTAEDEEEDFNPFLFIKNLPPIPSEYRFRACSLPRKTRNSPKPTLVLDLDETLLHSSIVPTPKSDLVFPVECNGQEFKVYVRKRPHLEEFMDYVSVRFEVIVFTASQRVYAEKLLNLLDPQRKWIKYRQYRDTCIEVYGNLLKDLTVLGRDLKQTIIIDNSIHAFAYQLENGIPIVSWFDDEQDRELLNLIPRLATLATLEDVRPFLRDTYRLHEHVQNAVGPVYF